MENELKTLSEVIVKRTTVISPTNSEGRRKVVCLQAYTNSVITGWINGDIGRWEIPDDLDREDLERLLEELVGDLEAGIE